MQHFEFSLTQEQLGRFSSLALSRHVVLFVALKYHLLGAEQIEHALNDDDCDAAINLDTGHLTVRWHQEATL